MTEIRKILHVEDDADIREITYLALAEFGGFEVMQCANGMDAIKKAAKFAPDLLLLDVMMPEMDGIETCEKIQESDKLKSVLVAFLTARGEDYSQIAGFDAGADDYILKPIKPKVLSSRVKALLKRGKEQPGKDEGSVITKGRVEINTKNHSVKFDGNEVILPRKEFKLLTLLCSEEDTLFTREEIMDKIWGAEVVVGDRTIDVHIRKLRGKLDKNCIQTVKGVGYKFLG